jgi:hypothetical protein
MHCSANVGERGDAAILFGLSGTGKTTLSADPDRRLIGDDETIWSDNGLCNLEDGCYAKLIDLNKEAEPVIAAALSKPGTIVENVPPLKGKRMEDCDPQELDLTDKSITENTRFSYPLSANPNVMPGSRGPHPETIVLLTADAFGVLPPVAVLDAKDVMYHFVSGFTAKLAGTEVGVTEPKAPSAPASARPSWRTGRRSTPSCSARRCRSTTRAASCSTPVGAAAPSASASASRSSTRARCSTRRSPASSTRQGRARDAPDLQPEDAEELPRRSERDPEPAQHVEGQGGLRRAGDEAARHVPQELRRQGLRQARHPAGDVSGVPQRTVP